MQTKWDEPCLKNETFPETISSGNTWGAKGEMIQISRGGLLKITIIYSYTMHFVLIVLSRMSEPIC